MDDSLPLRAGIIRIFPPDVAGVRRFTTLVNVLFNEVVESKTIVNIPVVVFTVFIKGAVKVYVSINAFISVFV